MLYEMEKGLEKAVTNGRNAGFSDEEIVEMIKSKFDLTPAGIINYLGLKKPIYKQTTNYGHFGKKDLPWEQIIKLA